MNRIFTPFPVLTTDRLVLRQLAIDDLEGIFALRSDTEQNKYIDRAIAKTRDEALTFINRIIAGVQKNEFVYWVITIKENDRFAGTLGLFNLSEEKKQAEIGYELLSSFQGQGIMLEAIEVVLEYAFQNLGLQRIEAFTHKDNRSSNRLLEKFSFVRSSEPNLENPDYSIFNLVYPYE